MLIIPVNESAAVLKIRFEMLNDRRKSSLTEVKKQVAKQCNTNFIYFLILMQIYKLPEVKT